MIIHFKCKKTEALFRREKVDKQFRAFSRIALRKLCQLNASEDIDDLRIPPANHLERLKGSKEGIYSIRINQQWRVCFTFKNGQASDVEIVDYH